MLDGLTNPRKIAFDAEGGLYVAEAGTGVDDGRITRRGADGRRTTVVDRLPSFPYTPSEIVGPAAVRPVGGDLYWIQGLGRDEQRSGGLLRLRDGRIELLASLRFAARGAPDGDTTISNPYDLLLDPDGTAYVSDASANVIWQVDQEQRVRDHVAWTAIQNPVPTGLARGRDAAYYVALFSAEPHAVGSGRVVRFDAAGNKSVAVDGLTTPIGVPSTAPARCSCSRWPAALRRGRRRASCPAAAACCGSAADSGRSSPRRSTARPTSRSVRTAGST